MAKIGSLHLAQNKQISGSILKVCADATVATITEIQFGEAITNPIIRPSGGTNHVGGAITSSANSPWSLSEVDFAIAAGTCLDGAGIADFNTADSGGTTPIVY